MFDALKKREPKLIDMELYHRSAVVVPLVEKNGDCQVLFEVRSKGLKRQPGEICFPGGGCETGESPEAGARREICEELLISESKIEIAAPMDIFVSPFNMIIYPYLGILKDYQNTFSTDEVLEVFTVPLAYFMETEPETCYNKIYTEPPENFPWAKVQNGRQYRWGRGLYPVHFYEYDHRIIWGITAKIMKNTARQIKNTGWRSEWEK